MIAWITIVALTLPVGWFCHEFSHAIAVWILGGEVVDFKPWPHTHKKRFWWARYSCQWPGGLPAGAEWRHIAPVFKQALLIPLWSVATWKVHLAFATWLLFEVGDLINWLHGYLAERPYSDGARWRNERKERKEHGN